MKMNKIIKNKLYKEEVIIPLLHFCPKLVLTGSNVLYMLGLSNKEPHDIDLGLTKALTSDELGHIMDLFKLEDFGHESNYNQLVPRPSGTDILQRDIIQLANITINDANVRQKNYKLDIFKKEYIEPRDIIPVKYNSEYDINICHPSIAIGHKAKYAFDSRVTASFKHMNDLKDLIINADNYFKIFNKRIRL